MSTGKRVSSYNGLVPVEVFVDISAPTLHHSTDQLLNLLRFLHAVFELLTNTVMCY